jgi:putative NADPH-quinone reductase
VAAAARQAGAEVEIILLRETPIEFCLNCRECTQAPGDLPGQCVQHDAMHELVAKIEAADGYILASPTNFGSVTALFKRFMERLMVYGYWPWGMHAPQFRKAKLPPKPAVLISSSAAPAIMGRWLYSSTRQLKTTAVTIGAKPAGTLFIGLAAGKPHPTLSQGTIRKAQRLGAGLSK